MANNHHEEWCKRGLAMGLKQISRDSCPRHLVGIRAGHRWHGSTDGSCWCETRLNDHGALWHSKRDGREIVIWEPYEKDVSDLAEIIVAAKADGLQVSVSASKSLWNPGATFAIVFKATR